MPTGSSASQLAAPPVNQQKGVTVEIGAIPIFLKSDDPGFQRLAEDRYAGFLNPAAESSWRMDVHLQAPARAAEEEEVRVLRRGSVWCVDRSDFRAEIDASTRTGWVSQAPNPYTLDALLRVVHSLVLAEEGGFLLHAASGVRNGRAFVFAGVSGAGKTTISRLAPSDATLLTDEISYVRRTGHAYYAYGTPFTGELACVGDNVRAPLAALYLLEKGTDNRIVPIRRSDAAHALMRNVLFFSHDPSLVERVFEAALDFVSRVPVAGFVFTPDERAWELVR